MTSYVWAKIHTRNRLRWTTHQNRQEWIDDYLEVTKAINEAKTESWKDLLQDTMSNSDGPNVLKVIQGLDSTPDANSSSEAMSHDGRTITDIKSKAKVFINHYARINKLKMSQVNRDLNKQFKKRFNVPSVDNKNCAPPQMSELLSASKRWKVKEHLALTTFHLHFSSHLVLWPSRNYYPCSTYPFHLFIPTHPEGCHNPSTTKSWEISKWSCIFLSHQSHIMYCQISGMHSCWSSLLYRRN